MELNESQKTAVSHVGGPCLVIAGPGAGKTAVLTRRLENLIDRCAVSPGNILVITFTRAAAGEMKKRFEKLKGPETATMITFGTFHSVFFNILRFAYDLSSENIVSDSDALKVILHKLEELNIETGAVKELALELRSEISKVKGGEKDLDLYISTSLPQNLFKEVFLEYERFLREKNLFDFEDMMTKCERLLVERPDILAVWQEKFEYILIDEFQDINPLQYRVIKLLSKPSDNLFVVGDDDQSIYGFRGSDPSIMLGFEKDFPECRKVILDVNYRSSPQIVNMSSKVICNNKNRFAKTITPFNKDGEDVCIERFVHAREENDFIVDRIREKHSLGVPFSEIAVIYRTNTLCRSLMVKLSQMNIPYVLRDNIPFFYDHFAVRDVFTYIRLAMGSTLTSELASVINRPKRYISRDVFNSKNFSFPELKRSLFGKKWAVEAVSRLEYDLSMIKRLTPVAAVIYIRKATGYDAFLTEYAGKHNIKVSELFEILDELEDESRMYDSFNDWFDAVNRIRQELIRRMELEKSRTVDSVCIATMHGSKGLEFDTVFIPEAIEGITPYLKALTNEEIEQERRMFYVAMTRAKKSLFISSVKMYHERETTDSRFLKECTSAPR